MNHAFFRKLKEVHCSVCLKPSLSIFVVGCFNSSLTQLRRLEELDLGNNEIYHLVSVYLRELMFFVLIISSDFEEFSRHVFLQVQLGNTENVLLFTVVEKCSLGRVGASGVGLVMRGGVCILRESLHSFRGGVLIEEK